MIVLEHTLMILLLMVGLLNAKPNIPKWAWWAIAGAFGLVLITPAIPVALPWEWFSALIIPILFWQAAQRLVSAQMLVNLKDLTIWLGIALGMGGILFITSELPAAGSLMFGLLTASMVWQATEKEGKSTHLGQIGPLALAFLLIEIAPAVEAPDRYAIALMGGVGVGAFLGYSAVHAAQRSSHRTWRDVMSILQVYAAYGLAVYFNLSGVAAAMMSVAVYVAYGTRLGLWPGGSIRPRPLDSAPVVVLAVLALAFFAWQTHVPITLSLLLEISLGLILTALLVWIYHRLRSESFSTDSYQRSMLRVGSLLVPAILLWPREALLDPLPLAIALLIATLVIIAARYTLAPLLKIYEWLDETGLVDERRAETGIYAGKSGQSIGARLVRDVMERDFAAITTTTPVREIARLFQEHRAECLPVVDSESRLIGIVTEHDLFVKERWLPMADVAYMAVFNEPVTPEQLPEVYAQKGTLFTAADVMTSRVVWVKESDSIGRAIRLMVAHGFKCLPVLDAPRVAGGKLSGIMSRSCIVRLLAQAKPSEVRL